MIYTTLERVKLKLKTRLQVEVDPLSAVSGIFPGVSDSATQMPVDSEYIQLTILEQEELLDMILSQVYVLPLVNRHLILGKIIDCYTCASVLSFAFQGVGLGSLLGGDVGNYSSTLIQEANYLVACLTVGRNLQLPIATNPVIPGGVIPKALVLPGEILATDIPTIITSGHTLLGTRNYTTPEQLGIYFDTDTQYDSKKPFYP